MKAVVTSKGQVTIPVTIRTTAKIVTGTELDFHLEKDGSIIIRPLSHDIFELKGIVKSKRRKPVTLKEMKKAVRVGAAESMK